MVTVLDFIKRENMRLMVTTRESGPYFVEMT